MTSADLGADPLDAIRALLRGGQRANAEQACESLVRAEPRNVDARLLLAATRLDRGAPDAALAPLREVLAIMPGHAHARLQLAVAEFRCGDRHAARANLEHLLAAHPGEASAAFHLGLLDEIDGDDAAAERRFALTLDLQANHAEAAARLGLLLQRQGRFAESSQALLRAWSPQRHELAVPIARAFLESADFARAIEFADLAIAQSPQGAEGWLVRGIALRRTGEPLEAGIALAHANRLAPGNPFILCELGCNARDLGDFARGQNAIASARVAAPGWHVPRWLHALGLPTMPADEAEAHAAVVAWSGGVDGLIADLEADVGDLRRSALDGLERCLPFALHYLPFDTTAATWRYGDLVDTVLRHAVAPGLRSRPDWRALAHGGRLRVGFVSCELREHTVMRYFAAWLEGLDPSAIELHAWHLGSVRDAVSERIAARAAAFRQVPDMPTLELAAEIRACQLDVLVHLEIGMDPRIQILGGLRLAPVQCAAYGHPVGTGLREIDFFLSGDAMEPANAQQHYRERLVRLPGLGVVPSRPPQPGKDSGLSREPGRPLLLCLQSLFKLVPAFDGMLARIVAATDAQVIFFESPAALAPRFLERLGRAFATHRLALDRHVQVVGRRSHADYLGGIAAADLVLDSTGFSGGATSLDALSVGTPIVTLEGEFMRGRQSAAMLRLLGADELVAADADAYVDLAIALCRDEALRDSLRARLRANAARLFADDEVLPALHAFLFDAARSSATGPAYPD